MAITELDPQKVILPTGVELHYVRKGQGPTVILIHGAMGDWRSWGPQWEAFVAQYDVISYSRRYSHPNQNDMPSPDHGAFVDAEDLLGLMDALKLEKVILVGSSYGAFTALALASQHPDRVIALAGVEPPMMRYAEMDEDCAPIAAEFRATTVVESRAAFERGDDAEGARILTSGIGGGKKNVSKMPERVMKNRMQNMKAARMLALSSDEFPLIDPEVLKSLPMPILLMSGAGTAAVHAAIFRGVCRRLPPHAQTLKVEGSGHAVSRQQPEIFNTTVLTFLAEKLTPVTTD